MATRKTTSSATRKKATAAKSGSTAPAAAKTAAKAAAAAAKPRKTVKVAPKAKAAPETAGAPSADSPETKAALRKRGLINAVTERSGIKRRDAKAAVEAMLSVLGEAIADGRGANLPGLGKMKVMRSKQQANARVFTTRVRQPVAQDAPPSGDAPKTDPESDPQPEGKDPLAAAAE